MLNAKEIYTQPVAYLRNAIAFIGDRLIPCLHFIWQHLARTASLAADSILSWAFRQLGKFDSFSTLHLTASLLRSLVFQAAPPGGFQLTMMTVLDVRARRDKKIRNSAFQRCHVMKEFLLELDYVFVGLLLCSRMRFPLTAERLRFWQVCFEVVCVIWAGTVIIFAIRDTVFITSV